MCRRHSNEPFIIKKEIGYLVRLFIKKNYNHNNTITTIFFTYWFTDVSYLGLQWIINKRKLYQYNIPCVFISFKPCCIPVILTCIIVLLTVWASIHKGSIAVSFYWNTHDRDSFKDRCQVYKNSVATLYGLQCNLYKWWAQIQDPGPIFGSCGIPESPSISHLTFTFYR